MYSFFEDERAYLAQLDAEWEEKMNSFQNSKLKPAEEKVKKAQERIELAKKAVDATAFNKAKRELESAQDELDFYEDAFMKVIASCTISKEEASQHIEALQKKMEDEEEKILDGFSAIIPRVEEISKQFCENRAEYRTLIEKIGTKAYKGKGWGNDPTVSDYRYPGQTPAHMALACGSLDDVITALKNLR